MQTNNNNPNKESKTIGVKEGIIVSNKMKNTVVVAVSVLKTHSKYLKKYVSTTRYQADDPENKFSVGDKVTIMPCRPISKAKRYRVVY